MEKRKMISPDKKLSVAQQCKLIGLPRSSFYYQPKPVSAYNQSIMRRLDEVYIDNPDFGSRQLRNVLKREGFKVNCELCIKVPLKHQLNHLEY
jgi:putative transposase